MIKTARRRRKHIAHSGDAWAPAAAARSAAGRPFAARIGLI